MFFVLFPPKNSFIFAWFVRSSLCPPVVWEDWRPVWDVAGLEDGQWDASEVKLRLTGQVLTGEGAVQHYLLTMALGHNIYTSLFSLPVSTPDWANRSCAGVHHMYSVQCTPGSAVQWGYWTPLTLGVNMSTTQTSTNILSVLTDSIKQTLTVSTSDLLLSSVHWLQRSQRGVEMNFLWSSLGIFSSQISTPLVEGTISGLPSICWTLPLLR